MWQSNPEGKKCSAISSFIAEEYNVVIPTSLHWDLRGMSRLETSFLDSLCTSYYVHDSSDVLDY